MGIVQKLNSNNWYQNFNTDTGEFIGQPLRPYDIQEVFEVASPSVNEETSEIARNIHTADQIEHQTIMTEDGRTIDLDQKHFKIIDENGRIEFDADGEVLISIAKDQLTYGNFIKTYRESSKQAMLLLLALQSNAAPLKRGGIDIAYMTDILVDHMIVHFSEEANAVWEALSAIQSSRPEDTAFRLTADDLRPYTNYNSEEALYHAFKKGAEELKKTNLEFDIPDPDLDGHNIMIHWNEGAEWVGYNKKTGEKAHFDVYTNDFYRVLMSSSGILHGTHWNRRISRGLKGYARALYLFCARNKNYTKYRGAIPGVKELTVDETRYELKIEGTPEAKYMWRYLKDAMAKINDLSDTEFSVNVSRVPEKGRIEGFRFEIKESRFIEATAKEIEIVDNRDDELFKTIKMLVSVSALDFTDDDIDRITMCAHRNNKDGAYMMQILTAFKQRLDDSTQEKVQDKLSYVCKMIEQGANVKTNSQEPKSKPAANGFHNFSQRDYDFDELSKKLLNQ